MAIRERFGVLNRDDFAAFVWDATAPAAERLARLYEDEQTESGWDQLVPLPEETECGSVARIADDSARSTTSPAACGASGTDASTATGTDTAGHTRKRGR